ncbi:LexA/Signal peptidase [Aspergillus steynii IBT 23096]|uniref:Mitochondrial inner membrane protease subunit 2 n=1 Tax=Aspergillus steynii IBT 23096 TaxID=1392250 RepID=A0A2I2GKJ1_9EURO|nr:LexA/Signal peptidase [Aspergillus steynii IBT 23096]PLB53369.1 LexA/Signal peptidase [Aspergillus steynii IBT 23096]
MPPPKPTRLFTRPGAKPRSLTSSAPRRQAHTQPRPQTQTQTQPPSFFSALRSRYASLPSPIRRSFRALRIAAPLLPIGLFFSEHICQIMWVRGPSMTPCLNEDYDVMHTKSDMVLVNMWPFGGAGWPWQRQRRLERGMVVTFRSPANPSHIAIKRIIGLPGDRITTREPCMKEAQIVPFNHVWLEGDAADPKRSLDSNTYGPVSISLITGTVMAVMWPRWRPMRWEEWEQGVVDGREGYRQGVRDRVVKEAVKLDRPALS